MTGRLQRLAIAALALALAGAVPVAFGYGGERERPPPLDLQVALRENGRCGTWVQQLPPLVVVSGFQPGMATSSVEICLRNRGGAAGTLYGSIADRVDSEVACTAEEPMVDPTCQPGQVGELGSVLRVVGALRSGCSGTAGEFVSAGFDALAGIAVRIAELKKNAEACVLLRVEYPAATSSTVAAAAQTDRLTWRYAFDLVE